MFSMSTFEIKDEICEDEDPIGYLNLPSFSDYIKAEELGMDFDKCPGDLEKLVKTEEYEMNIGIEESKENVVVVKHEAVEIKSEHDVKDRLLDDWTQDIELLLQQKTCTELATASSWDIHKTDKIRRLGGKQTKCVNSKENENQFQRHLVTKIADEKVDRESLKNSKKAKRKKSVALLGHEQHSCEVKAGKRTKHLAASQTLPPDFNDTLMGMRVKKEVFPVMRDDEISLVAKRDPLIVHLGEQYLKTACQSSARIISSCSNKMREIARMLIVIREMTGSRCALSDILDPTAMDHVLYSVKLLGGYSEKERCFKKPTLVERLKTSLKQAGEICVGLLSEASGHVKCVSREEKMKTVNEFLNLVQMHGWKETTVAIGSANPKNSVTFLALTAEVLKFKESTIQLAEASKLLLQNDESDKKAYDTLVQCSLVLTLLFNRRGTIDVQSLKIHEYLDSSNTDKLYVAKSERILTKRYKQVIVNRKGNTRPVIFFPPVVQEYITFFLNIRIREEVAKKNDDLFALSLKETLQKGAMLIRQIAKRVGIDKHTISSYKLKTPIAIIMQILYSTEDETNELLQFLGYAETHRFVPSEDLYQTTKISMLLIKMDKEKQSHKVSEEEEEVASIYLKGRAKWSEKEKQAVMDHFAYHIREKISPKRDETNRFKLKHPDLFGDKDWVKIKTFVYNQYRLK